MKEEDLQRILNEKYANEHRQKKTENIPTISQSLSDIFPKILANTFAQSVGQAGEAAINPVAEAFGKAPHMESFGNMLKGIGRGLSYETPAALLGYEQNIANTLGINGIPRPDSFVARNIPEILGKGLGDVAATSLASAPFAMAGEAAIPGLAGALAGGGLGGYATAPAGERTKGAIEGAMPIAAFKAAQPLASLGSKAWMAAFSKIKPEQTYKKIQSNYDKVKSKLGNIFDFVGNEAEKRGITKINDIDKEALAKAYEYGPKSISFKNKILNAQSGDYKSLRSLSSDLYRRAELAKKGKTPDYDKAEIFEEVRDIINDSLIEHFMNTGNKDLAQWLNAAKSGWADMKKVYESNPRIRKIVTGDRVIPKDLNHLLMNSDSMRRFMEYNPDIAADVEKLINKNEFKSALDKARKAAITVGGLGLGKMGLQSSSTQ